MAQILIVDDDSQLRQSFEKLLTQEGHHVHVASSGEAGVIAVKQSSPDLVIMDMRMPGMTGLEAYQKMRTIDPRLIVIIMTAYGTTEIAIEATKMGAFDYILKPFDIPEMLTLINQALETARCSKEKTTAPTAVLTKPDQLLGSSRIMQDVYKSIGRVAATDALVLIRGESGTGKELVALAIHKYSQRHDKPFCPINCVAIPDTLLESELFGYEKGAFTGANRSKAGRIEQASGGTLFLDEIGDMPLNIQAKILRLLQEKQFVRLGGGTALRANVRILAATNRNLEQAVADGVFREDLYYRLNVVTIGLPLLRDREGDVFELADHFLACLSAEMEMTNPGLAQEAKDFLAAHDWPGNVRELVNIIQKALIFNRGAPITRDELTQAVGLSTAQSSLADKSDESFKSEIRRVLTQYAGENCFEMLMDYSGRLVVGEALAITDGNRTRAARLLGMSRPTLLARIEKYGLKTHTIIS
ncbi:sigma-54-dependent transcriptional regulator [Pseudodesulfovibrio piezophilus]|uniref:DNA-binding transcriptional regulator NtrC n=1 Tax=Pseudodesulfovibrio piezophilus (strain DSM 21447 / JCM 15486 / C1TLV30) TaxID=1322246 RepID=M1WJH9_PSEP2|nr:sigma-54 dependent transcriptional regulator [Pseudodesulfovibrio piezophilus]CCH47926.1 Acetoacetate metabolism regulatory protein AtoC [Pseudodesulfovibrio piezophilus C1TLV30]